MNILILNGSPRQNGNTRAALCYMENILKKEHSVELLDVCSMDLSGCLACDTCKENGGHCICPDDSDTVIQKVLHADAILFGSPVYWWGISAQLKMALDKFYSQDEPFHAMKKRIGTVIVGGSGVENPQYRLIREQFTCIAEYLGWDMSFSLSFSAFEPGELMAQDGVREQLSQACTALTDAL